MTALAVKILRVLRAALDAADREWGAADSDENQLSMDFTPKAEAPAAPVAEEAPSVQEEVPSRRRRRTETTEENPAPVEQPQEEVPSRRSRRAAAVEAPVIVQPPFASIPAGTPISDVELSKAASLAAARVGVMKTMGLLQSFGVRDVKDIPQEQRAELLRQLAELQP